MQDKDEASENIVNPVDIYKEKWLDKVEEGVASGWLHPSSLDRAQGIDTISISVAKYGDIEQVILDNTHKER